MVTKKFSSVGLLIILSTLCVSAFAEDTKQNKLDAACEEARQVALTPQKKQIYQECVNKFGKSKSICQSEADAYNGNRPNGAPMFYELAPCEKAFDYRKKSTNH